MGQTQTVQYKSNGYIFTSTGNLVTTSCSCCGVPFAIPEDLEQWLRAKPDREFYCPNGHNLHYPGKSDRQKLKEAREALAAERSRHDQTQAQLSAQRGAATRARNERDAIRRRAANGVCPCCGRTFKQLARHMQTKHPDYVAES